ncbi:MAG: ATP synthase alpha chain [Candidatus Jettenia ecosi]|uniref:ATP synthase subunit alpha n=1 Tax=Candidatus Jettenia ecosi TaxID=2494326 RepID=A0A533QCJ3_9BACT|nr:MAG: ATP synthase alpha chain [Candidatus Jettenia ecosi]
MVNTEKDKRELKTVLDDTFKVLNRTLREHKVKLESRETGTVHFIGEGIARVKGLPGVKLNELIRFSDNKAGIAFNLDPEEIGIVLLDEAQTLKAGSEVYRTGRVLDTPVGDALLGRVVDSLGRPLDERGPLHASQRQPIEREAPGILDRAPVSVPLQTGILVIDALIPIGRGQRELILGDRQTGKTSIAVNAIINQRDKDVICVYCSIGQKISGVAKIIDDLRKYRTMKKCIVVVATGEDSPGLRFAAPYAATSMAEYFMEQGKDVLIVYDDLSRHARTYREISLLLRRPPAREAYPGDIFYIHSRLLERSTHLSKEYGGGSLTALPIVETEAQNISAYIPTNLISITDGQIYLSPELFQKGILPALDVGKSVSRLGGKAQLSAYHEIAGNSRLSYSQFEELESFARFGTRLDERTRKILARGQHIREILKQSSYDLLSAPEQVAILLSVTQGLFDNVPIDKMNEVKKAVQKVTLEKLSDTGKRILADEKLNDDDKKAILSAVEKTIQSGNYSKKGKESGNGNL